MKSVVKFFMAMSVAAFSVSTLVSSCVNSEYDLSEDNINTDITLAQDGLVLPLGKTVPITLGSLYDKYGQDLKDYIQNEDGKYGFRYAGSFDFSKNVAEVKDLLKIDALEIAKQFSFDLSSVSLDGLQIPGSSISPDPIDVSSMVNIPSITLPEIHESLQIKTGVERPDVSELDLNFAAIDMSHVVEFSSLQSPVNIPDLSKNPIWNRAMSYEDLSLIAASYRVDLPPMLISTGFDEVSMEVPVKLSLPKGIASVDQIELSPDANVEVDIKVLNPMFVDGKITTKVDMDFKSIFHVDRTSEGTIDEENQRIKDNFIVTNTSTPAWQTKHVYYVDALALTSSDWKKTENGLVLDKELNVKVSGVIENEGLRTSLKCLYENGNNPMQIVVTLKLNNFAIENVQMEIDPISITKTLEMPVSLPGIDLPEIISEVKYVDLENSLNLSLQANLPEALESLNVELESLEIAFPKGFVVENNNYSDGKLSYSDLSLTSGFTDAVTISRLNLPKPVGGTLSYNDNVVVTAKAVAAGTVNSKDLLDAEKSGDVDIQVDMDYAPALKDYSVAINDYPYIVDIDPVKINEKLPDAVGTLGSITAFLEGNPVIKIALEYPTAGGAISIIPDKTKGLKITFPEMLRFKTLPSDYNYSAEDNSISFTGSQIIPNIIELPIDRIVVTPQFIEGDGYYLRGEMKVEGGVCLEGTTVDKSVVDALVAENASISFGAEVPELKPARLSMDQYVASIQETIPLDMMKIDGVPEMIKSIDVVNLKDVYLDLVIDASSVVGLLENVDLDMDLDVTLPKLIVVEGAQSGNVLSLSGKLNKENKIVVDPIKIVGLDLSDVELKDETACLDGQKIDINGNLSLKNISVNLDDLKKEDLLLAVNGSIATKGSDKIDLEKVEATVDYQLDPFSQTIPLAGILGDLGNNIDYTLDLNRYHLALDLKTNLALPLKASVDVLPYYGEEADESKKKTLPLSVNWSLPANDTTHTRLWISNSENDKPLDKDYTHAVLDLLSLVNDMPDSIRFDICASTEKDAKFVIEPAEDYVLKADYAFELPFEFGDDFHVSFSEVLDDLPDVLNELLGTSSVGLSGKVTNNLPLQFDLELQLLDGDGNAIPLADGSGSQTIKPCALDGTPQETELKFILSVDKTAEKTEAKAIELRFMVSSRGASGIQFHEDCFIQAELALLLPEGISLNVEDLMNPEENNK